MKSESFKTTVLLSLGFALAVVFLVVMVEFVLTFRIDYSNVSHSSNLLGDYYFLSFNSVPTVINGITATTSIMVGFTGAIIGILYQIFKDDEKTKLVLLDFAVYDIIPLLFLMAVYIFLPMGYVEGSLKLALIAFILSLLIFFITLVRSSYRLSKVTVKK